MAYTAGSSHDVCSEVIALEGQTRHGVQIKAIVPSFLQHPSD